MKLNVLCDCDDNKVCVGNFDGNPMWHFKKDYQIVPQLKIVSYKIKEPFDWKKNDEWFKHEAYVANSD